MIAQPRRLPRPDAAPALDNVRLLHHSTHADRSVAGARIRASRSGVAMLTEGTYPLVHGGVSTWCDQLVRGLPDIDFEVLSLTATGREPVAWQLPSNIRRHTVVPLWGVQPAAGRAPLRGADRRRFLESYERLLDSLLDPADPADPDADTAAQENFSAGLYELADLARAGRLTPALRTEAALHALAARWAGPADEPGKVKGTLHDALTATDLLEHLLRPLGVRVPDGHIAHAVSGGLAVLPALASQEFDGTPFLLTEHGVYLRERYLSHRGTSLGTAVKTLLLGFHRRLAMEGYRRARLITPCNHYNRRWEERGGADADRIRTVYNGVDPKAFPEAGPEPETLTLVWCGRIDPIKDLETLIHVYAELREEFPELRLRLFGGVPRGCEEYRDRCAKLAATLGVADGMTFEGRTSKVSRAYAAGSVVMLSSISEGFPYSLIEAMSCGRVTVSTDVGGVKEAVGDAGVVVPPRDPAAMAAATAELLRDADRRAWFGRAARQRVIDQFTLRTLIEAFCGIYGELGAAVPRFPVADATNVTPLRGHRVAAGSDQ